MPKGYPYKIKVKVPSLALNAGWIDGGPDFRRWMSEHIGKPYERWITVPVTKGVYQEYTMMEVCFRDEHDAVLTTLRWS